MDISKDELGVIFPSVWQAMRRGLNSNIAIPARTGLRGKNLRFIIILLLIVVMLHQQKL
jgi:hypothetical protein